MTSETTVFSLTVPAESRYSTQYDGTPFTDVKGVKIVDHFVTLGEDGYSFNLTGALFLVKARGDNGGGLKFRIKADLDEDQAGNFWVIDLSMLNTNLDELMIIEDFIQHELNGINGGHKIRLHVTLPEALESTGDEE